MDHTVYTRELSPEARAQLDDLYKEIVQEAETFIGYPCNSLFDYTELERFMHFPINNVGDPFNESNFHLNTHSIERDVLRHFQRLTGAPEDDFWGYITSGGTEGNLYGIFLARELHPDGIVYYSEDTHYSVAKILRCLHVRNIMIKSRDDGSIDLDDLRATIRIHRDSAPIIFANVGTTMKGAIDDLVGIRQIFDDLAIQGRYIHADAALSGMILPFVDKPQPWDFNAGIDSISISGHKMIGAPIPCGVLLARGTNVSRIARNIEYIGTLDTTILGSRNAIAPLMIWYALQRIGTEGFRKMTHDCFKVADYTIDQFKQIGLEAWRHENSVTVVFPRPSMRLIQRWQLAVHNESAHLITMPHVTRNQVDRLVEDLRSELNTRDTQEKVSP